MLADPKQASKLLTEKLPPETEVAPERIVGWIAQLDADKFADREKATEELHRVLDQVEKQLRVAAARPTSAEASKRIKHLLEYAQNPASDPIRLRNLRAVETLERSGTPEAVAHLEKLARGCPRASLTREAQESLERLKRIRQTGEGK